MRAPAGQHFDVLIAGAGLSGIGAACHLERECPDRSYAVLEARDRIGGTWDLFRYPGIRSDSDMHTLGYSFRPWEAAEAIADGPSILRYISETAAEYGVRDRVRTGVRVVRAQWDGEESLWTVYARHGEDAELTRYTCEFLMICCGYYRYDRGHAPPLPGAEHFSGPIVHPQLWPEDLDFAGKRVVVIGSGATAVTLVPAMAGTAAHVTMLQRSPSYVVTLPSQDGLAARLRRRLSPMAAYRAVRWKNVALMTLSYQLSRRRPKLMKAIIRRGIERQLPAGYDVDTHFKPNYNPWDQRLCVVPDGDLFAAVRAGRASIATDAIETFTGHGLRLKSGRELEADIVVTATGLEMLPLGGISLAVDGRPVQLPQHLAYRGAMLDGVPNVAFTMGYTNASWTLKADITADFVCRLLNHMRAHGYRECVPVAPAEGIERRPLIDLSSGYVERALARFPQQGNRRPWRVRQNYALDLLDFRLSPVEDGVMRFGAGGVASDASGAAAAVAAA